MNVSGGAGHHELDSDPEEAAGLYMAFAVKIKARYHDKEVNTYYY